MPLTLTRARAAAAPAEVESARSRADRARQLQRERERFGRLVVSCVGCGVLCLRNPGLAGEPDTLHDVQGVHVESHLVPTVGAGAVLRQGIGFRNGRSHECPPTAMQLYAGDWRELEEEDTRHAG